MMAAHERAPLLSAWPLPLPDLRLVNAILVGVCHVLPNLVVQPVLDMSCGDSEAGNTIDDVDRQTKPVYLVLNGQSQGRVDTAFLSITVHVHVVVVGTAVGQFVDQGGVTMEVEDNRLIICKQRVEVTVRQPMRVLRCGLKPEQINHVDETDF